MDGLCHSDHTPTSGLIELKTVFSPVRAWLEDGKIALSNEQDFEGLDNFSLAYRIESLNHR